MWYRSLKKLQAIMFEAIMNYDSLKFQNQQLDQKPEMAGTTNFFSYYKQQQMHLLSLSPFANHWLRKSSCPFAFHFSLTSPPATSPDITDPLADNTSQLPPALPGPHDYHPAYNFVPKIALSSCKPFCAQNVVVTFYLESREKQARF